MCRNISICIFINGRRIGSEIYETLPWQFCNFTCEIINLRCNFAPKLRSTLSPTILASVIKNLMVTSEIRKSFHAHFVKIVSNNFPSHHSITQNSLQKIPDRHQLAYSLNWSCHISYTTSSENLVRQKDISCLMILCSRSLCVS